MSKNMPLTLLHILNVYKRVYCSHQSRKNAIKDISRERRIDERTIASACTRGIGINTNELDNFLWPNKSDQFCGYLIQRFPIYQEEIEDFFCTIKGIKPKNTNGVQEIMSALYPTERNNVVRYILLSDIRNKCITWLKCYDIPDELKHDIESMVAQIDSVIK